MGLRSIAEIGGMRRTHFKNADSRVLRAACATVLVTLLLGVLLACGPGGVAEIEVRINNISQFDFTDVSVADQSFGDIDAGGSSDYVTVSTRLGYAVIKLTADGRRVTGQTLNMRAKRFTYDIDVVDLLAGQLAISVVPEEDSS